MQILGISIDKPFLRIALVEKNRKRSEIIYLKSFLLDEPENVKQFYTPAFKGKISSALCAKNLLMRSLDVNTNSTKHLDQVIAFQSEATSYFNEESVLSVPLINQKDKEKSEILLFTASREAIREHLSLLENLKFNPDCVTASPLSLIDYIKWKLPDLQDAYIVDLGSDEWTCLCLEKGELKKFHSIAGGTEALLAALCEDRKKNLFRKEVTGIAKQIDLLQLKAPLNTHLSAQLIAMKQELSRIIYSFSHIYGPKPVFFTGRVDAFGQMQEYLEEALGDSITPNITHEIPKEEQKYALSIGLAIGYGAKSLQFRKDEFFPQKYWKRAGLYSLCFMAASLLISISLVMLGNYIQKSHSQEMLTSLHAMLNQQDPPLAQKIFSYTNEEEILNQWYRAVSTYSKEYPYVKQYPKVANILSWIYGHPLIVQAKQEPDPIFINYVHYQLLQCPKLDTPKDLPQAKVEIEFTTKNPLHARKFHQSLHQGEGWVDNSQDIQWEALENLYRTSFYLKMENPYAP